MCNYCAQTHTPFWGALIGYIGSAPPAPGSYTSAAVFRETTKIFYVGADYAASAPATGRLWLNKNTDAYSNYTVDNSGQVEAAVAVFPPETEAEYTVRAQAAAASIIGLEAFQKALNFCVRGTFDHVRDALVQEALSLELTNEESLVLDAAFLQATISQDIVNIQYELKNGKHGNAAWDIGRIIFAGVDQGLDTASDYMDGAWWAKAGLKLMSVVGARSAFDCAMAGAWFSGQLGGELGKLIRERVLPPATVDASIEGDWTLERSAAVTCINFSKGCLHAPLGLRIGPCSATECTVSRPDGVWQQAHTLTRAGDAWDGKFDDIGVTCTDQHNVDHENVARLGLHFSVTTAAGSQATSVGGFYTVQATTNPPDCTGNARARYPLHGSR